MRRIAFVVAVLLAAAGVAAAQPGQTQPYAPPPQQYPPPQPYPAPQPYATAPYGYGYQGQLSPEDQELLMRGEITDGQQLGGGLLALFVGFGSGQAVQGRFGDTGWIFLVGEGLSAAAWMHGFIQLVGDRCTPSPDGKTCEHPGGGYFVLGMLGILVFRTWGTIDGFVGPTSHNRKVRALKMRLGIPIYAVTPYVAPAHDATTAGLMLRF